MQKTLSGILVTISILSFSQTFEQRENIKKEINSQKLLEVKESIHRRLFLKEEYIQSYLRSNPTKKRAYFKDGKSYFLYSISTTGKPIYITTKDNQQISNSKANSLYSGGSINTNIDGNEMTVGIWDAGLPNSNHELLQNKVNIQFGQSLGIDQHATAVSGILVGKNINSAKGIAYNATSQCFDWESDISEMADFAGTGYLISNHSYGYGNNEGTDKWIFGAYDSTAKEWDSLLKETPYYLPFVAVGNEQDPDELNDQNQHINGNWEKNGFDMITGASASKNVMTVGAINIDNEMSSYSNWGPTDDGRIKPDIVTLGTDIQTPLSTSNNGYEIGEGTSYASPAAAGAGLLLQQYYYSLNGTYMKAAMLKALMLHSADDDSSNNGPDVKFGWGILNVEKAATIIKESNISGNSRMEMVTTNPINNNDHELVRNFIFNGQEAKASICWTDDDGIEQTQSDGVDNSMPRIIYKFGMKLEQPYPLITKYAYQDVSSSSDNDYAEEGTTWFQSNNNYLQSKINGTTANSAGKVSIRKSSSSPSTIREFALIITGVKQSGVLSTNDILQNKDIVFYSKEDSKIKLINNKYKPFGEYKIFDMGGNIIKKGTSHTTEIDYFEKTKGIFILKYQGNKSIKFSTF